MPGGLAALGVLPPCFSRYFVSFSSNLCGELPSMVAVRPDVVASKYLSGIAGLPELGSFIFASD